MSEYLTKYLQYLVNTGSADTGLPVEQFDDDWEPIGPNVRHDLQDQQYAVETQGRIFITPHGRMLVGDRP